MKFTQKIKGTILLLLLSVSIMQAQVVINEASGDAGQSDGSNDGILELAGVPGTDISCWVVSNSEWAVVIPPGTTIPADGVFMIGCSEDVNSDGVGTSSTNTGGPTSGLTCAICDFPNMPLDLDVCDPANAAFYDPAASGFTIDNSGSGDGDQIALFQPDGTIFDAIYWGTPSTTVAGATTGGASGTSDNVAVQTGLGYTLGTSGIRGDGGNATGVPVMPSGGTCAADGVTYTMPPLTDPVWVNIGTNQKGCNSSYIRIAANTPDYTAGSLSYTAGTTIDPASLIPSSVNPAAAMAQWGYTNHPNPGEPNGSLAYDYAVSATTLCAPGNVTFTVNVYNYQNVSDMITSGDDDTKVGSYFSDGTPMAWTSYTGAGTGTTTLSETVAVAATTTYTLQWDDFSNGNGSSSFTSSNECYERDVFTVTIVEPLVITDMDIDCDAGDAAAGTINAASFVTGGQDNTYELFLDGASQGAASTSSAFALATGAATTSIAIAVVDGSGCSASGTINVNLNCLAPPICPSNLVNTGTSADAAACPGATVDLCLNGTDIPAGGMITWYATTDGSDPITTDATTATATIGATAVAIGSVDIPASTIPSNTIPVINEVLYNPINADGTLGANGEFIEIAAAPGTDLSGYLVYDPDWSILLPAGTVVGPSGFLVVGNGAGAELPAGKSVDVDYTAIPVANLGGNPMTLTNANELVGLSRPDGSGGFTFVTGVDYGGTDTDNVTPLGTAAGGGTYDFSAGIFVSGPTSEANGESIGLIIDGDINSGYDESGSIANSPGINTGGCPNSIAAPDCFTYTIPDLCAESPATITIEALISPIDPSCTDTDFNYVGATSTFTVDCPSADLIPTLVDICVNDPIPTDAITVNITNGTGPYTIEYSIDGVTQTALTGFASGDVLPISNTNTTLTEAEYTLVSITDEAGSMCTGSVDTDIALVTVRANPTATLTANVVDITVCDNPATPLDEGTGSIELVLTGTGPWEVTYEVGGVQSTILATSSPYTATVNTAGTYTLISVNDEVGCAGSLGATTTATVADTSPSPTLAAITPPATICNDGNTTVTLADPTATSMAGTNGVVNWFIFDPNAAGFNAATQGATDLDGTTAGLQVAPTTTTTYYAVYSNDEGCNAVTSVTVTADVAACCSTEAGMLSTADCIALCATGNDLSDFTVVDGQTIDVNVNFADPSTNPPVNYDYAFVIVNSSGVIVDIIDESAYNNASPANFTESIAIDNGLTSGSYTIHGFSYDPMDSNWNTLYAITSSADLTLAGSALEGMSLTSLSNNLMFINGATNTGAICADIDTDGLAFMVMQPVQITASVTCNSALGTSFPPSPTASNEELDLTNEERYYIKVEGVNGGHTSVTDWLITTSNTNGAGATGTFSGTDLYLGPFNLSGGIVTITATENTGTPATCTACTGAADIEPIACPANLELCDCSMDAPTNPGIINAPAQHSTTQFYNMTTYQYVLVDTDNGNEVLEVSNTGFFTDLPNGNYEVFAFNILDTDLAAFAVDPGVTVGMTYAAPNVSCFTACGSATYTINCFCCMADAGNIVRPTGGTVDATTGNQTICFGDDLGTFTIDYDGAIDETDPGATDYETILLLTDASGAIVQAATGDFDFSTLAAATYTVYALNYNTDNTPNTVAAYLAQLSTATIDGIGSNISEIVADDDDTTSGGAGAGTFCLDLDNLDNDGLDADSDMVQITILELPNLAEQFLTICSDENPYNLTGLETTITTATGTFAYAVGVTPVTDETMYTAASGDVVVVTFTDATTGCTNTTNINFTVIPAPDAGMDGTLTVCNADPSEFGFNLFDQLLGGTAENTGTWAETGATLSGVTPTGGSTGTVDFQNIAAGTYEYTYTVVGTGLCLDATATVTITVEDCFDLALIKELTTGGNITAGSTITFDISVINQGTVTAFDVVVEDYFNATELSFVSAAISPNDASGSTGSSAANGFLIDQIAVGATAIVQVTMTINAAFTGTQIINNAEITGAASEDNGPDAIDEDSAPNTEDGTTPDGNDNDTALTDGSDDYDPAAVSICPGNCNSFPWNGQN